MEKRNNNSEIEFHHTQHRTPIPEKNGPPPDWAGFGSVWQNRKTDTNWVARRSLELIPAPLEPEFCTLSFLKEPYWSDMVKIRSKYAQKLIIFNLFSTTLVSNRSKSIQKLLIFKNKLPHLTLPYPKQPQNLPKQPNNNKKQPKTTQQQ